MLKNKLIKTYFWDTYFNDEGFYASERNHMGLE